jgi:hypothetical protein
MGTSTDFPGIFRFTRKLRFLRRNVSNPSLHDFDALSPTMRDALALASGLHAGSHANIGEIADLIKGTGRTFHIA